MLSELFQNKLFLQYLSGLGSGIAQDKSVAGTLNEITQQNISAQSQAGLIGLFKKMLGGEMPGAKASMDEKGMKLDMPSKFVSGMLGEDGGMGAPREGAALDPGRYSLGVPTPSVGAPTMPNIPTQKEGGGALSKLLNPSGSQPGISASDLAGLTPENVSAALAGALNIEELSQKKMTDVVDMIYKGASTKLALARATDILEGDPLDRQFPINMPGVGVVTLREWQSLPMDDREYASYVHTAKKLGDADIMSKEDFVNTFEVTEKEQFLRAAMEDPKLMTAAKDLARSGATRIALGTKLEEKKAFGKLEGQLYFSKGKHIADLNKHMNSKATRMKILTEESSVPVEKVRFIEDAITGRGGTITDVKIAEDGKTMIWTVLWPSGDKETIKHAVRD